MPTDVMSNTGRNEHFGQKPKKTNENQVKSGFLVLVGPGGMRQDVRVVVYRTSLEHFAVIHPRKRVSKAIGVVNLRNTAVEPAESKRGFTVRQKGYDNAISAKFACSEREMISWVAAFTTRGAPHAAVANLPVLEETEES